MRVVKAIMTYYDCQIGERGNECFKKENFLPSILLSSSPLLPLWSLSQSSVCHVLISVFFIAYSGLGECHSATDTNKMLQSLEETEINFILEAEFVELTFDQT